MQAPIPQAMRLSKLIYPREYRASTAFSIGTGPQLQTKSVWMPAASMASMTVPFTPALPSIVATCTAQPSAANSSA